MIVFQGKTKEISGSRFLSLFLDRNGRRTTAAAAAAACLPHDWFMNLLYYSIHVLRLALYLIHLLFYY